MFLDKILIILAHKKKIFVSLFLIGTTVFFVFFVFNAPPKTPPNQTPSPFPSPTQPNLEKDYSNLDEVIPGKSTLDDLIRINGKPASTSAIGNKTYAYYSTPLAGFINIVLIENGVVAYSLENVFGEYRGTVSEYQSTYGSPDLTLFDRDGYPWRVYLSDGIAIENDGRDIGTILYFIPQTKEGFMEKIASELSLSETLEKPPIEFESE